MPALNETFEMYVSLRNRGQEATTALQTLRFQIEILDAESRAELVRRVREWESERQSAMTSTNAAKSTPSVVKPIAPPPVKPVAPPPQQMINCPQCGKPNPTNEVFCYSCGYFLKQDASFHDTVRLSDPDNRTSRGDYFGPNSTLVLLIVATNQSFKIRPQNFKHEIVVGRGDGATMRPDVDLSEHGAGDQGVSRLHMSLTYNGKMNTLSVSDMRSANGTFINGQRLYPQEVRVLRHGDELRLGRMVLRTYYYHPESNPVGGGNPTP
ncbi:MAG: FHA domain-containing protein [Chloroflexi bacterium]|jgi:hypothetical protein|uniref:FHA domain-containing protein n=1 Tax=Candidatus Flexifilum breve TaxID=3140694 RepID=UPI0031371602|nr:FHA domain-containing protein [Chloroflexota bacterium]MBK9749250.1 FHA domain-containing protein [Chloroflexota bacterium]